MDVELVEDGPWWLPWVVPILTAAGAVGTVSIWLMRRILFDVVRKDFERMLDEKHEENIAEFDQIKERLDRSEVDRQGIRRELTEVKEDVAYLRGRSTGTFKRPPLKGDT